jgi:hypothetical protein
MKDKEVFKFKQLDPEKLASSLGLGTTPEITFVKKSDVQKEDKDDTPAEPRVSRL